MASASLPLRPYLLLHFPTPTQCPPYVDHMPVVALTLSPDPDCPSPPPAASRPSLKCCRPSSPSRPPPDLSAIGSAPVGRALTTPAPWQKMGWPDLLTTPRRLLEAGVEGCGRSAALRTFASLYFSLALPTPATEQPTPACLKCRRSIYPLARSGSTLSATRDPASSPFVFSLQISCKTTPPLSVLP